MSMFKEVADIKTSDQLHLPVPEAKFETVVAKPSEIQKEMVQELSKRAAEIHSGAVDASVVKNGKGKKVIVFKYKPKKGYRRKQGHRQPYTKVTIGKISV